MTPGTGEQARRRLRAVRVRATVIAVLAVALALIAGGVALVLGMRTELSNDVRDAARERAGEVARVIEAGRGVPTLAVHAEDEEFLQVVAADGTVVAASENVEGRPALARLAPGGSTTVETGLDEDAFLVVAVGATDGDRQLTVLDGRAPSGVAEATWTVTRLLLIGVPVLLVLAAAATWAAVGRTLGRVARAEAAQRRFVSDASHELRSPVAAVRQHAEVALAHPERADTEALAGTVREEAVRIQRLVDDLLLLARADESALNAVRRPVDLDDLVLEEVRRLRAAPEPRIESSGVGVPLVTGEEAPGRSRPAPELRVESSGVGVPLVTGEEAPGRSRAAPELRIESSGVGVPPVTGEEAPGRSRPDPELRIDSSGVGAARVTGDEEALRRLVRNLGENAARHARARVAFALTDTGDGRVRLSVDDDGPGIRPDDRGRVFDRFVRLDESRAREEGGAGLGLAIVAEVAAAHRGRAEVAESAALGGARFVVTLPSAGE